jgi:hypothetical protein
MGTIAVQNRGNGPAASPQPGSSGHQHKGQVMNESRKGVSGRAIRLHPVQDAPADANLASMIDVLQEHLKLAREGKLRSVAVVSVSADGTAIGTQWSCAPEDLASLIGKLTVLTHDLMAARR